MATSVAGSLLNSQAQAGAQPPKPAAPPALGGPTAMPLVNPVPDMSPGSQEPTGATNPQSAALSAITPQNTLRGQQITSQPSAQTQATGAMVQQAAQGVNNAQVSPIAKYQAAAAPYQQQGQSLFNQATGAVGQAQGYGSQAAQSIANTGFGQYGAINPTAGQAVAPQTIQGPSFTQGAVNGPGVTTGPLSGLKDLAFGGDTNALRGLTDQGIQSLYTAPDRSQLASDQFKLLQEQAAPQFAQQVRQLGQGAAAFGRMGSGLVNTQLADLGTAAATSRDQQARQLAMDAAQQTMADRLARVNATQSGLGQFAGLDTQQNDSANQNRLNTFNANLGRDQTVSNLALNQAGFNAGLDNSRNAANFQTQNANAGNALQAAGMNNALAQAAFGQQAQNRNFAFNADQAQNDLAFNKANTFRGLGNDALAQGNQSAGLAGDAFNRGNTERNFLSSYDQNANDLAFNKLNSLGGLQNQQFNQGQQLTNDLRGERGYQDQLAQQAQNDAINQWIQEQAAQQQGYNQWQGGVSTLGNLGNSVDPTGAMQYQGNNLQQQGQGSIDAFAQQMANQFATPTSQQQLQSSTPIIPTWGPQYVSPPLDTSKIPSFGGSK